MSLFRTLKKVAVVAVLGLISNVAFADDGSWNGVYVLSNGMRVFHYQDKICLESRCSNVEKTYTKGTRLGNIIVLQDMRLSPDMTPDQFLAELQKISVRVVNAAVTEV